MIRLPVLAQLASILAFSKKIHRYGERRSRFYGDRRKTP